MPRQQMRDAHKWINKCRYLALGWSQKVLTHCEFVSFSLSEGSRMPRLLILTHMDGLSIVVMASKSIDAMRVRVVMTL